MCNTEIFCFSIYEKLIQFCAIDELGTNYPKVSKLKSVGEFDGTDHNCSTLFLVFMLTMMVLAPKLLDETVFSIGDTSSFMPYGNYVAQGSDDCSLAMCEGSTGSK